MRARIYIITYNSIMDCILTNYHTILFVEGLLDLLHTFLFPSLLFFLFLVGSHIEAAKHCEPDYSCDVVLSFGVAHSYVA